MRAGAGMSIYTDVADIDADCPTYLDMDALRESNFIVSFVDANGDGSMLKLMDMTAPNAGSVVHSVERAGQVYEVATLHQSEGLFVAIEQDSSPDVDRAVVFAGRVQQDGTTFSLGEDQLYSDDFYSMNPTICRLSDTTFAMSYYDTTDDGTPVVSTRVGKMHCWQHIFFLFMYNISNYYF